MLYSNKQMKARRQLLKEYTQNRKEQQCYNRINNAFSPYFIENGDTSFDNIITRLIKIEKDLLYMYTLVSDENDFRTGYESYGYSSIGSIKESLEYISDRWNCTFRIRWLLDLITIHKEANNKRLK